MNNLNSTTGHISIHDKNALFMEVSLVKKNAFSTKYAYKFTKNDGALHWVAL